MSDEDLGGERERLEEERAYLLGRLASLERDLDSGEIDPESAESLREDYVARAAGVLRSLERLAERERAENAAEKAPTEARSTGTSTSAPAGGRADGDVDLAGLDEVERLEPGPFLGRFGIVAAAGVLALVLVLGALAVSGGGTSRVAAASAGAPSAATASNPRAVASELFQARTLENQGRDVQALQLFQQVLQADPRNPEALSYEGWLLREAGLSAHNSSLASEGRASIQAAVAVDPGYPDAHALLGYILFVDDRDAAGAAAQFEMFLADHPPEELVQLTKAVMAQAFSAAGESAPRAARG